MNSAANTQLVPLTEIDSSENQSIASVKPIEPKHSKKFWDKIAGDTYIQVSTDI